MHLRITLSVTWSLLSASAVAAADAPKPVYALPKPVYDIIRHFETLGIDLADVDADNLGFDSESLEECIDKVPAKELEKDALSIAYVSCLKRHPPNYEVIL